MAYRHLTRFAKWFEKPAPYDRAILPTALRDLHITVLRFSIETDDTPATAMVRYLSAENRMDDTRDPFIAMGGKDDEANAD